MPTITVDVSRELADYWGALARREALAVETWLACCGSWAAALDLPLHRMVLQQPAAARELDGIVWEITQLPASDGDSMSSYDTQALAFLIGNVVRFSVKDRYARVMIATHRNSSRGEEKSTQVTDLHSVIAFEPQRSIIEGLLASGQKVFVQGRLQYSKDPASQIHYTRIVCEKITILSPPEQAISPPAAASAE